MSFEEEKKYYTELTVLRLVGAIMAGIAHTGLILYIKLFTPTLVSSNSFLSETVSTFSSTLFIPGVIIGIAYVILSFMLFFRIRRIISYVGSDSKDFYKLMFFATYPFLAGPFFITIGVFNSTLIIAKIGMGIACVSLLLMLISLIKVNPSEHDLMLRRSNRLKDSVENINKKGGRGLYV
ncbi:MAG: hypothetical protein ABIB79_03080 [archaeon]